MYPRRSFPASFLALLVAPVVLVVPANTACPANIPALAASAAGSGVCELRVVVQAEPGSLSSDAGGDFMQSVGDEAAAIWLRYDVRLRWIVAQDAIGNGAYGALRILVEREARLPLTPWRRPLGFINFVAGRDPIGDIHLSTAHVAWLTQNARLAGKPFDELPLVLRRRVMARIVGRSAAHEIGHYLLRSPVHTPSGLMRASFTVGEFLEEGIWRYSLDAAQRARLALHPLMAACRQAPGEVGASMKKEAGS
jgi:hypothetical protein